MPTPRHTLVTGANRGLGLEFTRQLLVRGDRVVATCRRPGKATALNRLAGEHPGHLHVLPLDVAEPASHAELVRELPLVLGAQGRLDMLVNNAGGSPYAEAATASPRFSESILRLNLLAPLNMAQQAYQVMQHQPEGGVIIFVGSVSASRPSPGTAVYGAAKAGIVALASSLAVEWGPKVRVLTISPGLIRTEQSHLHYGDDDGIAAVGAGIPAGRMGEPEDIANACLYAASPMAAYFSGTNLLLHGGGERPSFLADSNAGKA